MKTLQKIFETLPDDERNFIFPDTWFEEVPFDKKKHFLFGNENYCVALLSKGKRTRADKKTAYWLTIVTHPNHRNKKLGTHLILDEIKPFLEKVNGKLYSRVMKNNVVSIQWHKNLGAYMVDEDETHYIFAFK